MQLIVSQVADSGLMEGQIRQLVQQVADCAYSVHVRTPMTEVLGSGFCVPEGILTAKHVVSPALVPGTGDTVPGTLIRIRPLSQEDLHYRTTYLVAVAQDWDLAVLAPYEGARTLQWADSDNLKVGDEVVVLAAPGTLSEGPVAYAASGRVLATSTVVPDLFRYEIPVQPGSSGGPVLILDSNGKVVGINLLQERLGDKVVGSGLKANSVRAALQGGSPPRPAPVVLPEGLTGMDVLMIGGIAALGLWLLRSFGR